MILESQKIINAVYNSKWTEASPKQRKMLCLIMMRAQTECSIRVGFFEASLNTLTKVGIVLFPALKYPCISKICFNFRSSVPHFRT